MVQQLKMPVSAWYYIPTSLTQEQAAKTEMPSVVRIQQKEYLVLGRVTSRLFVSIYCLPRKPVQICLLLGRKIRHKLVPLKF